METLIEGKAEVMDWSQGNKGNNEGKLSRIAQANSSLDIRGRVSVK